jgi:hypothetical protein
VPDRFGSLKVTAHMDLVYPTGTETDRKIAAPLARIKTDLIICTEQPKRVSSLPRVRIEA